MQTQKPTEQKSEQSSGRANNNLKNIPASQKPVTKKNTVRTTEYKKMIEICLSEPDSVTRDEFIAFQSAMGYGQTVRLIEEGKRRKMAEKGEKKDQEPTSTVGKPKQKVDTLKTAKNEVKNNNEIKTEQNKVTTEKSLTKTILDTAKSKINEPATESKVAAQTTAKTVTQTAVKAATQAAPKTAIQPAAKTTAQVAPKTAVQTAAKTIAQAVPKATVQTAAKAVEQAEPKAALQTTAKIAAQAAPKAALQTVAKAAALAASKSTVQKTANMAAQAMPKSVTQLAQKAVQTAVNAEQQVGPKEELKEKAPGKAVPEAALPSTAKKAEQTASKSAVETTSRASTQASSKNQTNKSSDKQNTPQKGKEKSSEGSKAVPSKLEGGSALGKGEGGVKGPSAQKINESLKPKREVKPAPKITGEDPGKILSQLGSADATQVVNTFSEANAASKGAFDKEKDKAQKLLPEIPTPTGLEPVNKQGNIDKKQSPIKHKMLSAFKAVKAGGKAQEGNIQDFNLPERDDLDADDVMKEAKACTENPPEIGMAGEADPSQIEGFESEASESVENSKQTEVEQIKKEFGENNIAPLIDNTILKAKETIRAAAPKKLDIKKMAPVKPEVASRVDPSVNDTLQNYMNQQTGEYEKGKAEYDAGVETEKATADEKIEGHKAEAKEKQQLEQEKAKADVAGYRDQWQSEVDQATAEYDNEANTEVEGKRKEVGDIKDQKDGEVKSTLKTAEKDAEKECDSAKKDADEKEKEGKKEEKSWLGKAWDWVKDKAEKLADGIKKAINGIFNALRSLVKTIFEKAKQAALALIEAGRKLIVDCIKGLGELLKKLVKKLLEKFPAIAEKICALIDKAVSFAVAAVNKIADGLKKAVTFVLDTMAKGLDNLFAGLQKLYNGIMDGLKKFLSMDFMEILKIALEAAMIAAEIAAAFASMGGSVLAQIVKWIATTLPSLISKARAIIGFVDTIRSIKFSDIKEMLSPSGIADFLVKGLFGELKALDGAEGEKGEKEEAEPAGGGAEKGLVKILNTLTKVFNKIKGVYGKVAGAINKVLPVINITNKKWFDPFSMVYAGVAKVIEVAQNPAQALGEGVGNLKAAAGNFFGGIKTKVTSVAVDIKEKVAILGKPAELLKLILNKGVDMVLNFIIMNPPSALLKAVFKLIEAVAGKSLVELIRQTIPFADKLLNSIAESGPVQAIASPLQEPISKVSGAVDDVTSGVTGIVDDAEQKAMSAFGSGEKLISGFIGGGKGGSSKGGNKAGGGKGGGGDFFGTLKSGIHTRLVSLGEANLKTKGKALVKAGVDKGKDLAKKGLDKGKQVVVDAAGKIKQMLTPKVKFKLGNEDHELWVESGKNKNVVMMASEHAGDINSKLDSNTLKQVKSSISEAEQTSADKITKKQAEKIASGAEAAYENRHKDDIQRIAEIVVEFKRNPKHDAVEFERQLKGQENGLNSLTVYEFLKNRDRYIKEGRAPEGNAAQKAAREKAKLDKIDELREKGLSRKEAEEEASKWLKGQAALHNPDQIAGGNPTDITGMGDTRINSSLGSQWKNNASEFDKKVRNLTEKMTEAEKKVIKLNVKLKY